MANILFTRELHRRFHAKGLSAVAVHPGVIATNLANDTTSFLGFVYRTPLAKLLLDTPEKGAEPLVWLATSMPGTDWESGAYYEKHKLGKVHAVAAQPGIAKKLWEYSEAAVVSK